MAKIYTYVVIALTLQVLLALLGVNHGIGVLIQFFGLVPSAATTKIFASPFYSIIFNNIGIISLVAGAVTIALFGKQTFTLPVTAAMASALLLSFIGDWLALINLAGTGGDKDIIAWFLWILIVPFVGGYLLAIWDWIRSPGDT